MKKTRNPKDRQDQQKSPAFSQPAGRAEHSASVRLDGTFLDRIKLPAMSGEEALRRYDGHLQKHAGHGNTHGADVDGVPANEAAFTARDGALNDGQVDRATHGQDGQTGPKAQKGQEASSRADLAALAEWPLLTRIIGLVGTLGMLVALIVLGLFVAGWVNGL